MKKETLKISEPGEKLFDFNVPEDANDHFFMSEELPTPNVNKCDTQRLNMFSNHINQAVHLVESDFPKVFTGFENQIGEYSIAYKKAKSDATIVAKVWKNPMNYTLVLKYRDGTYDVVDIGSAVNICEEYGYRINDCVADKDVGDTINEEEYFYKSDNYDDEGNFSYGRNLKAVYLAMENLTYEDGFVISESAAKKLTSYKVEKTTISVNTNDILLNIYADRNDEYDFGYHSIPKVGEYTKDHILVASRREEAQNIFYNFQQERIKQIDPNDQIYYTCGGIVSDINIYSNVPLKKLAERTDEFSQEVYYLYQEQYDYYKELADVLDTIIHPLTEEEYLASLTPEEKQEYYKEKKEYGFYYVRPIKREKNPNKYTDELAYKWKFAHEYIDERISWRSDGKRYDNFKIEFTILKENPLAVGCKCTGRYGNKGVCSAILPDERMPYDPETGIRAEICLNPLGVINRNNPAQIYEQYLNFIADHVVESMKACNSYREMKEIYLDFLKYVCPKQYDWVDTQLFSLNGKEQQEFFDDIIENGIYIHQPPFVGNVKLDDLAKLYVEHPEWVKKYKCEGIESPLVIGDLYFIRLKHESSNKLSVRSKGMLNIKNMPSKSPLKKEKKALYNDNPLRFGEMEQMYMQITKRPDLVSKLLRAYSTSTEDRQNLVELLVTAKDPLNIKIPEQTGKPITRQMLDNYLAVLEIALKD